MTRIIVEAEVRPSENKDKVLQAMLNFFDFERIKEEKVGISLVVIGESSTLKSLLRFHRALRDEKILDSARKYLYKGVSGNSISFMLNKQAAAVRRISFVDNENESPLGPIKVRIEYDDPQAVIDWLTPKTAKGVPLWENPIPQE
ncbi:RNA-binding domain-containing protein [Stygiolobus caldivivus]|uniref:UPF0201 protein KN1_15400 n=1 Tax=Stygiolobus caldivivus TaxID=2824673 RepID=A0A8D5ZFG6_9CREN|nr:RNA-binding domain-containing protein [Stygiolobus caldivivus]BCU70243.1 hypothetical protein KN1_15400 [Stygiolobus caldivivus]